jgi:hypothetical protein
MLAEVDRPLTFGVEDVTRQRDRLCAWRRAVASTLDVRAQVEQPRLATLQKRVGAENAGQSRVT